MDSTLAGIASTAQRTLGSDRASCFVHDGEDVSIVAVHTTATDPRERGFLTRSAGRPLVKLPICRLLVEQSDPLPIVEDIQPVGRIPALALSLCSYPLCVDRAAPSRLAKVGVRLVETDLGCDARSIKRIGSKPVAGVAAAAAIGLVAYAAFHDGNDAMSRPDPGSTAAVAVATPGQTDLFTSMACGYGGRVAFVCTTAARNPAQVASAWQMMTGRSDAPPEDLLLLARRVGRAYGDPSSQVIGAASTTQVRGWAAVGAVMRARGRPTNPDALPQSRRVWFVALQGRFIAGPPSRSPGSPGPPTTPLVRTQLGLVVDQATHAPLLIAVTNRPPRLDRLDAPLLSIP
ncbi:hypothetical protein [Miltoncostaea oceani]|uniref:hypothetical protein n=1 Tax=Miltoncostaea oceani TaxID=2843216 RepID=UPI001C3D01E2|nr:hypothetical protein [Miltoncostaea oceani]